MKKIIKKLHHEKSAQKRVQDKGNFLLTHVYCGKCGALLCGISRDDQGENTRYYECTNQRKHQCDMCGQSKDIVESVARYFINERIHGPYWRFLIMGMYFDKSKEEHRDSRVFRNMLRFYDGIVGDFDDEELRQFIFDHIVDKIYLHEEKMVITFRISDDTQELSYEETLGKIESLEQIMSFMGGE